MIFEALLSLMAVGLILSGLLSKVPLRKAESVVGGLALLLLVVSVHFWGWTPKIMISIIVIGGAGSLAYTRWKFVKTWKEDQVEFRKLRKGSLYYGLSGFVISVIGALAMLMGFQRAFLFCGMGVIFIIFALWEYVNIRLLEARGTVKEDLPKSATG
jgi:hypothetical protein